MCYTIYVQVIGTAFDNPAQLIPERNVGRFFEFENWLVPFNSAILKKAGCSRMF